MAEQSFTAVRDLIIGGERVAAGDSFTAEPEAVRVALARGWLKEGTEPEPKPKSKSKAKPRARRAKR